MKRTWGHRVAELSAEELAMWARCEIDGCDEPATHVTSLYYNAAGVDRPWQMTRPVCPSGADEFAREHGLELAGSGARS